MKIGEYTLHPIEAERFSLDGGAMFGIIPKLLWSRNNPPDEYNRIKLIVRLLLIRGKNRNILIDTGIGTKLTKKQKEIYQLNNKDFNLISSLLSFGLKTDDITDVILTHLHFDHAGGSTFWENGVLKLLFPNAKHYVQKSQWNQSLNPTEKDRGSFMPDDYLPLKEYGVLELLDGNHELLPGINIIVFNGHTPGLQALKISDEKTTLLFCSDLLPTTSHISLNYITSFDLFPLQTLQEKKVILNNAVDENWILFFEHDPIIPAGKVKRTEKGFAFDHKVLLD